MSNNTAYPREFIIQRADEVSPVDNDIIRKRTCEIFGAAAVKTKWAEPDWRLIIKEDGGISCSLEIIEREVLSGGCRCRVAGIGNLMTPVQYRGKGLAGIAMRKAMEFIDQKLQIAHGFLLCSESLVKYYAALGWKQVLAPVFYTQPSGRLQWHECAMVYFIEEKPWPPGEIDLQGYPW
ncbi:MAG: GNAT family N-acetyltransferase [Kiritimatiellae bacterium]|nr:GNAT family N-acetyltransferase [Kiritimatiellia bacterium]MDD5522935.1 GNAT family N-acetyltransferase [Kiritimatiellia bacterium]